MIRDPSATDEDALSSPLRMALEHVAQVRDVEGIYPSTRKKKVVVSADTT
jgi:hypothetical protein